MGKQDVGVYDRLWAREWQSATVFAPSTRTRYRIVSSLMRRYGVRGAVLDVGGGNGAFWRYTRHKLSDVHVILLELSPVASLQSSDSVERTVIADITDPKTLEGEVFDAVCCCETLEHIADDQAAVRSCHRLLKSGGLLFVSVPHSMRYWTKSDEYSHHERRYEWPELRAVLAGAGFTVLEWFTWGAWLYKLYHRLTRNLDQQVLLAPDPGPLRRAGGWLLYHIFRVEDVPARLTPSAGVALYAVARK